jgi:hypothetical protein
MSKGVVVVESDEVEFEDFDGVGADFGGGHKLGQGSGAQRNGSDSFCFVAARFAMAVAR